MRIKYSRKRSFFNMWLWYVQLLGEQKRYGLVSRYDQSAWTDNQGRLNRGEWRGTSPLPFERESNGAHVPVENSSIGNFMIYQIDLKIIYCSYSRTQNSEGVSITSVIILKVNIVAGHVNAKRMTIIVLFYTELKQTIFNLWYSTLEPRAAAGGERAFAPFGNWNKESKFYKKPDISSSIPFNWLNYCNDSLFAGMTLTLHKIQVLCSGVIQWWACRSLICLQMQVAKLASEFFNCWCLQVFLRCFRDPIWVPSIENRVPRIRKNSTGEQFFFIFCCMGFFNWFCTTFGRWFQICHQFSSACSGFHAISSFDILIFVVFSYISFVQFHPITSNSSYFS